MELYEGLMKQPNMRTSVRDAHREVIVRIKQTQAGMTESPKYDTTLAYIYQKDLDARTFRNVRMVWTKRDTYLIKTYWTVLLGRHQNDPEVLIDTSSRLEAITRFEGLMVDAHLWYVDGRTGLSIPA